MLDYPYFNEYDNLIAKDLSKQQALNVDPKIRQQIDSTGNLERNGNIQVLFIIKKSKRKMNCESIVILFSCDIKWLSMAPWILIWLSHNLISSNQE